MQRPELQGRYCLTLKLKGFVFAIVFGLALSTGAMAQNEAYTPMPLGPGFGPVDTSAPPMPPKKSSRSSPPRNPNSAKSTRPMDTVAP